MPASGVSRADQNRAIRQEALREQLSQGKHIEYVIEIAEKLEDLDTELKVPEVNRLKAASDIRLKLIDKYLPALRAYEGPDGESEDVPPLSISFEVKKQKAEIKITNAGT